MSNDTDPTKHYFFRGGGHPFGNSDPTRCRICYLPKVWHPEPPATPVTPAAPTVTEVLVPILPALVQTFGRLPFAEDEDLRSRYNYTVYRQLLQLRALLRKQGHEIPELEGH